jgi:hypothetical protein
MKFAEECPKCGGKVQTKNLKKSIGLGIVDIPVAQFCLSPVCNWYQDFSEAAKPDDIKQEVVQIKIPKVTEITKQNMLVFKGSFVVIILSILLIMALHLMQPQPSKFAELKEVLPVISTSLVTSTLPAQTNSTPVIQKPKTYTIKMDVGHGLNPSFMSINTSDIIIWSDEEIERTRIYLISKDGLFNNRLMQYTERFTYRFNQSGNYTFVVGEFGSLKEYPNTIETIFVK